MLAVLYNHILKIYQNVYQGSIKHEAKASAEE